MDARVTKQRLSNMLSYDWLKILGAIAAAALVLAMFFTMIATRATDGQTFMVYAYNGLSAGEDYSKFGDTIASNGTFSYDILNTGTEVFSNNKTYGDTVFQARRAAGEGRVMFVSDYKTADADGNVSSQFDVIAQMGLRNAGEKDETMSVFLDPETFLADCGKYLETFFGADLQAEEPNAEETRKAFLERNGKDNRFRKASQKEEGIKQERERLIKLKADYFAVKKYLADGTLPLAEYRTQIELSETETKGNVYAIGLRLQNLPKLLNLVYYEEEVDGVKSRSAKDVVLTIFDNGDREGDLRYETVSFIAYLVRAYGDAV